MVMPVPQSQAGSPTSSEARLAQAATGLPVSSDAAPGHGPLRLGVSVTRQHLRPAPGRPGAGPGGRSRTSRTPAPSTVPGPLTRRLCHGLRSQVARGGPGAGGGRRGHGPTRIQLRTRRLRWAGLEGELQASIRASESTCRSRRPRQLGVSSMAALSESPSAGQ